MKKIKERSAMPAQGTLSRLVSTTAATTPAQPHFLSIRLPVFRRFVLGATLLLAAQIPVLGQSWPQISLSQPIAGFTHPTHLASARDGSGRLFVVEQPGRIRIIENGALLPTPFLDITARLGNVPGSLGLLSVAFPPDFASRQHFYVNYVIPPAGCNSGCGGSLVIARYRLTADPNVADANSEQIVLSEAVFHGHWGGELAFGPIDGLFVFRAGHRR